MGLPSRVVSALCLGIPGVGMGRGTHHSLRIIPLLCCVTLPVPSLLGRHLLGGTEGIHSHNLPIGMSIVVSPCCTESDEVVETDQKRTDREKESTRLAYLEGRPAQKSYSKSDGANSGCWLYM